MIMSFCVNNLHNFIVVNQKHYGTNKNKLSARGVNQMFLQLA